MKYVIKQVIRDPKTERLRKTKKDLDMNNHKGVKEAFKILCQMQTARQEENNPKNKI